MNKTTFQQLGLIAPILDALKDEGYTHPTPIQEQSVPIVLQGHDLLGCAQTGTGKTAAFAIPVLQLLQAQPKAAGPQNIKVLVLTPTRELAIQIGDSFSTYGKNLRLKNLVHTNGIIHAGGFDLQLSFITICTRDSLFALTGRRGK